MDTETRLERLERQLACARRRTRWLMVVGGFLAAALVMRGALGAAQAGLEEVRARAFVLVDSAGRERAKLVMEDKGPALMLLDEKGVPRAVLDGKPGLLLFDEKGGPRAALAAVDEGPGLALFDEKRVLRAGLALGVNGTPGLALFDEKRKARVVLDVRVNGTPGLALYDVKGKPVWSAPK